MKYLLFMYGEVDNPDILNTLNTKISEITSGFSNYIITKKSIVYYIDSDLVIDDLDYYILVELSHLVDFYFLFPGDKKFTENLGDNIRHHLFGEDEDKIAFGEFDDELEMDEIINMKDKSSKKLDDILDKIKERGISSLTKEETWFLNYYSK